MPKIVYQDPSTGLERTVQIGSEPIFIGRASECQIQTDDARVSRRHARIYYEGNYWIEDLGSSNGIYVGQNKVERAPFRIGDVITCGSLVLRMLPDMPGAARPATVQPTRVGDQAPALAPPPMYPPDAHQAPPTGHAPTSAISPLGSGPSMAQLESELGRERKKRMELERALNDA